jgi:hypothetical protein
MVLFWLVSTPQIDRAHYLLASAVDQREKEAEVEEGTLTSDPPAWSLSASLSHLFLRCSSLTQRRWRLGRPSKAQVNCVLLEGCNEVPRANHHTRTITHNSSRGQHDLTVDLRTFTVGLITNFAQSLCSQRGDFAQKSLFSDALQLMYTGLVGIIQVANIQMDGTLKPVMLEENDEGE